MENNVKVNINGKTLFVRKGTLLKEILDYEKPCGGHGLCGKCNVSINGKNELICKYIINSDIEVLFNEKNDIFSKSGVDESGNINGELSFALDIGTTTIALALVSLGEKRAIKVITKTNPQVIYGADVMTRIEYCQKNPVDRIQLVLIDKINEMINEFKVDFVDKMYVSANTTMLHIFFGIDCTSIGVAPYKAKFLDSQKVNGKDIGINSVGSIISLPSIASFVGADIVAGMNYIGMPNDDKFYFLVDLGTNAEVVLFSKKEIVSTSAAAGPCFEGANISCGMSATDGAIYSFKINNNINEYCTINNKKAVGICGTGLIDVVSELLKNNTIDETGFMEEEYEISDNIYFSSRDVRQYQLAKSAVYSSIITLMQILNISFNNIEKVFVSGGFSAMINIENAIKSGLFPQEFYDKMFSINNSSLLGTIKYAIDGGNINQFVDKAKYIDLTLSEDFNDLFIENMLFNNY